MIRLRFAPSPTGHLHIGGLRTALFSWLYARRHHGTFLFRLEDTDRNRLVEAAEAGLIRMLEWAGLDLDEGPGVGGEHGPYRQSERLDRYHAAAQQLIEQGDAYPCFCSPERLEQVKAAQREKGETPRYDQHCRHLPADEVQQRLDAGTPHVIRMKIPDVPETLVLDDLVRGKVAIETTQTEDQVLIKGDGFPTYHLAVVVDDHAMQITHVVRGEEWLPSFPKHLLLYRYLGWTPPQFAHLPLILNADRTKLSKRQGAVAVEDFQANGYLPEALVNFVALLGWSPDDDQELLSLSELQERFDWSRVNKSGAVFDRDKLNWMNQQYLQQLEPDDLFERARPFLQTSRFADRPEEQLRRVVASVQNRLVTLQDLEAQLTPFFDERPPSTDPEVLALLEDETAQQVLAAFIPLLEAEPELDGARLGQLAKQVQKDTGIKGKALWMPLRAAITQEVQGPDLHLLVDLFGKDKCLRLLQQAQR